MNDMARRSGKVVLSIMVVFLLLVFTKGTVSAETSAPQSTAGQLTCAADSAIFDCVQIDPYTVRWNVISNPYNNGNITGQFSVENPNAPVYITVHWSYAQWGSIYNQQTNPRGYYGIVGASGRYENDGGSGTTCSHNSNQLCGSYSIGTWKFTQSAVTDASGRATVGFQQVSTPSTTVYWTPQEAFIIVSSVGYSDPIITPAGKLTCYSESSIFDCVQIDAYTVRWNVIGNPYNNGNITGKFSVENPGGRVHVTAHWEIAPWVSISNKQTNPKGSYGILATFEKYTNDGGVGITCSHNSRQLCGNYPIGTWNFLQNAVTDTAGLATVGFQQTTTPTTTLYWTPGGAYIIVSSAGYDGIPGTPPPTYTPASTFTATWTPTITPSPTLTYTPTATFTSTATATFTPTNTPIPRLGGSGTCWIGGDAWPDYTVHYDIVTSSLPEGVTEANWLDSIEAAAQTWSDVTPSHFTFVRQAGSDNTVSYDFTQNPQILAGTAYWSDDTTADPDSPDDPYFDHAFTKINPLKAPFDTNNPHANGAINIQELMIHEFGHWLFLDDLASGIGCSDSVMTGANRGDGTATAQYDLGPSDENGINYKYP